MKEITAQMREAIAQSLGSTVRKLQEVRANKGRTLIDDALPIDTVLCRERHRRIGEVIQLGQCGIDVSLFAARRGRIAGCTAKEEENHLGIIEPELLELAAQAV